MKFTSVIVTTGLTLSGSSAFARCPDRAAFPWTVSDQQGASQPLFIPTTTTVVTYRICVNRRVGTNRTTARAPQSNINGLVVRLACGLDGKEMAPPCISVPLNETVRCLDVRTEGTIFLTRTAENSTGPAEGITCRTE
jgi:hypothetical protein